MATGTGSCPSYGQKLHVYFDQAWCGGGGDSNTNGGFWKMACHLRGRQLYNSEEMAMAVREWSRMQEAYFYLDEM